MWLVAAWIQDISISAEGSTDSTGLGHCVRLQGLWEEGDLSFFPRLCLLVLAALILVTLYPLLTLSIRGDSKLSDKEMSCQLPCCVLGSPRAGFHVLAFSSFFIYFFIYYLLFFLFFIMLC